MPEPMLVSRDQTVIETVLAAAAAVQVMPVIARDTETVRRNWTSAPVCLLYTSDAADE